MKLLILSDSHGDELTLQYILRKERSCDVVIHLGDGASDMLAMTEYTAGKSVYLCKGNCDSYYYDFIDRVILKPNGLIVYGCHGHRYNVKHDIFAAAAAEYPEKKDVFLFGHTHVPYCEKHGGTLYLNPGSVRAGRYAVIEINGENIVPQLCSAEE